MRENQLKAKYNSSKRPESDASSSRSFKRKIKDRKLKFGKLSELQGSPRSDGMQLKRFNSHNREAQVKIKQEVAKQSSKFML